ncbi:hypothetical protein Tco_1237250 [Tanacetum coccineum]
MVEPWQQPTFSLALIAPWLGRTVVGVVGPHAVVTSQRHDVERYMRGYEAYVQFLAMANQEAEDSGSGIKRTRTYIPRERKEAEQRLLDDYFGDDETPLKYLEEKFRRRYRMSSILYAKIVNDITSYDGQPLSEYFLFLRQGHDATGRASIGPILNAHPPYVKWHTERILELKQRNLKNIVMTFYTPYPSRKIRRIGAALHKKPRRPIRRIQEISYAVKMDESDLTIEEYIELHAEKAQRRDQTFNWETTIYDAFNLDRILRV